MTGNFPGIFQSTEGRKIPPHYLREKFSGLDEIIFYPLNLIREKMNGLHQIIFTPQY